MPSGHFRLRGRQDVVLTSLGSSGTQLVLAQKQGPLEAAQLATGVTVVEVAPLEQVLRLALSPGTYLARRIVDGQVLSKEVLVNANESSDRRPGPRFDAGATSPLIRLSA